MESQRVRLNLSFLNPFLLRSSKHRINSEPNAVKTGTKKSSMTTQESTTSYESDIESLFNQLDRNGNGYLSRTEFQTAIQSVNLPNSDDFIADLITEYTHNHRQKSNSSVSITKQQFISSAIKKERTIHKIFNKIDSNSNGFLTSDEIISYLSNIGISATDQDANRMISMLNKSSQTLNYQQFRAFAVLLPHAQLKYNLVWAWFEASFDANSDRKRSTPKVEHLKQFLAGGLSGAFARTLVAPVDRVVNQIMSGSSMASSSVRHAIWKIYKSEGFLGLFRGNTVTVFKKFPQKAIEFAVYDKLTRILINTKRNSQEMDDSLEMETPKVSNLERFLIGSSSGAASQSILHAFDVAKMHQSMGKQGSIIAVMIELARTQGIRGMYRGYVPSLIDTVAGTGIGFMTYEAGMQMYRNMCKRRPNGIEVTGIAAVSSAFTLTCCMPLAAVVKRMVAQGQPGVAKYRNVFDCVATVARTEGVGGFYRGILGVYLKIVPSIAFTFLLYDQITRKWAVGGTRRYSK
uniref:EF-hand domain-containing protein n=2 Tax=Timspurckia oligopyrenoides TaxID=708627 RepID=A0A7S0ZAT8_9RHOD|mmetsp:Transcript_10476/g.18889  ORF Transcript_10476/g.18889 Transcript_10476/m.18889 type:complete len:518 (+) Transcript_10476:99-1652(+)|eukprot:CAMPEP_0182442980 /NCGR_PEP_ID=MMETSP1172-20130603/1831_1 /TAXON_ID=708627 /ORGANISM="Timspurckia oligopyrenoides, Strain CCMP3278" /LENGTH=517 /DNA_ID=CAMNT_0024638103 /DNA_START=40 /DNA_END=1593 /DNA_ORIENTATION=+